jgi:[protein-PII] uridylyltransferase
MRRLAGNVDFSDELAAAARVNWAKGAKKWLPQLADAVETRHEASADVAYALEPDLKEGRGGLRDVHAIQWSLAALDASSGDSFDRLGVPTGHPMGRQQLAQHYNTLLETRVELHRVVRRPGDRLLLQNQDDVAAQLDDADADELMKRLSAAARTIAWTSDEHWFDLRRELGGRLSRGRRRRDLTQGMELVDGRVEMPNGSALDELSILRVGIAAATEKARIGAQTLTRLHDAPDITLPWSTTARQLFTALLACGDDAVPVIETLDIADLWCRLLPEWEPNRCRPQRNAYHRFTVDRHLLEAVARAADLRGRVERDDLLLLAALLHDIGKGYPGDHTIVGMKLVHDIATRMGFDDDDRHTLVLLVEHHLLLPDVATRRDLDDPATIRWVAACSGTIERLHLLGALTEADSIATGSSAWGPWKAGLVAALVERAEHVLAGGDVQDVTASAERLAANAELLARFAASGEPLVLTDGNELTLVCSDRPGLFSRVAGVLAVCGLDVSEASADGDNGIVLDRFRVTSAFSRDIPWARVQTELNRALSGRFAIESRLAERARSYRRPVESPHFLEPNVRVLNKASDDFTVVEVVGSDSIGLLYRLTRAIAELDLDIGRAKVATIGSDVVDAFYVRDRQGNKVTTDDDVAEITMALKHALEPLTLS